MDRIYYYSVFLFRYMNMTRQLVEQIGTLNSPT